jgi:hypothetical protein
VTTLRGSTLKPAAYLLQLVVCRLAGSRDPKVGEGAWHGQLSSEKSARNLPPAQKPVELFSEQAARDCPKPIVFGQPQRHGIYSCSA